VREAAATPADVHDGVPAGDLVGGDDGAVYADKAHGSGARQTGPRERGIEPRITRKARRAARSGPCATTCGRGRCAPPSACAGRPPSARP